MKNWKESWNDNSRTFKKYCAQQKLKFQKGLECPEKAQRDVLDDILSITQASEFGREHKLKQVKDIKSLRNNVPIRSYDQYKPWIEREILAKGGVLSTAKLVRWLKTSGSTGSSKKIPYSIHWMENYRSQALGVLWASYLEAAPEILSHPYAILDTQTIREKISSNLNGLPYQGITNRNPILSNLDWMPPWANAPWMTDDVPNGYENRMYYRLRYFLGQDLRVITAINPSTLVAMHLHLRKFLPMLVKEVHNGTFIGKKIFVPNSELAEKISSFTESSSLTDIWPNLSLITCWTTASAKLYKPQLDLIFPGVKVLPFMTCGTEGVVTLPADLKNQVGVLAITQGFYEFIPAEIDLESCLGKDSSVKTLLFNELEFGKEYHLIMSQANGLYRLAVGDVYKVIGFVGSVPRIEFVRRHGTYFSFTGEKITESQMLDSVESAIIHSSNKVGLFMCFPVWGDIPYYRILIETDSYNDVVASVEMARLIDTKLSEINEEYQSKRASHRLGKVEVSFIKTGVINNYLEDKKSGANATQYKYKPLQTDFNLCSKLLSASNFQEVML
ncbi:MAG: GH3 auxin-responsive promoter family protein [Gammaproteobacteria bacterium]